MASTSSYKKATISFTLPISCQICLGKVKQPVICPNQHVFCTPCLDVWLRHNQLCPTCRVPITPESPCKQIRGGPSPQEEKAQNGLGRALRRARVDVIFDEYENEIKRLEDQVKQLQSQKRKVNEAPPNVNKDSVEKAVGSVESEASREEVIHQLTLKLKASTSASKKVMREIDKLKETSSKLRDENVALSIENGRLKQSLAARSPRKFEKYAQAALQRKVDQCTKEILQLKKALTRSDSYIDELDSKLRLYQDRFGPIEVKEAKNHKDVMGVPLSPADILGDGGDAGDWKSEEGFEGLVDGRDCGSAKDWTTRDKENLENWSSKRSAEGGGENVEYVAHPLRLMDSVNTSKECLNDGPSPAKRRLVYEEKKENNSDNAKSLPYSNKHGEDHSLGPDHSEGTDISSYLERPSSSSTMTPSTSFSQLQLRSSHESAMQCEGHSKWQRPFSWNKRGRVRDDVGDPPSHRRSRSPRRVPRSLTFANDEESSPSDLDEEGLKTGIRVIPDKTQRHGMPLTSVNQEADSEGSSSGDQKTGDLRRGWINGLENVQRVMPQAPGSSHEETLDGTILNLDFSLTPEFVDCTKLLKEAENRLSGRQSAEAKSRETGYSDR